MVRRAFRVVHVDLEKNRCFCCFWCDNVSTVDVHFVWLEAELLDLSQKASPSGNRSQQMPSLFAGDLCEDKKCNSNSWKVLGIPTEWSSRHVKYSTVNYGLWLGGGGWDKTVTWQLYVKCRARYLKENSLRDEHDGQSLVVVRMVSHQPICWNTLWILRALTVFSVFKCVKTEQLPLMSVFAD